MPLHLLGCLFTVLQNQDALSADLEVLCSLSALRLLCRALWVPLSGLWSLAAAADAAGPNDNWRWYTWALCRSLLSVGCM